MDALISRGVHPEAAKLLKSIGLDNDDVSQGIGSAPASAGTHAKDGEVDGHPYCAAMDIRARGKTDDQIKALLDKLGHAGIAGFYRHPGTDGWPADEVEHIHAIYAGAPMKRTLRRQIHDWLHARNGLASHGNYHYWRPCVEMQNAVRMAFLAHNPTND